MARDRQPGALGEQAGILERRRCKTEPPGGRARNGLGWLSLVTRPRGSPDSGLHSDFQGQPGARQELLVCSLPRGRVGTEA